MVIIGLAAAWASTSYRLGTLARMGPGLFPCAVGILLALTGVVIAATARSKSSGAADALPDHAHGLPDLRGAACIVLGTVAFVFVGEYFGLLPATFAIVFISALGDRSNTVLQAFLLAAAMMIVATIVFWWALQLQLPLYKWGN
ncbi:tripartite tricarboxylate transporter TctB family protein [Xylophilus sp.]|uniref:tripartite tricarboxylate transporter TctB family protein n=1 Tax=Xylophilus sp. TaxID=2653893 RepID=UPI002D7F54E7|nr:tripartite tricarboxylate transporter TctB family protein [Xylophilus sp.]